MSQYNRRQQVLVVVVVVVLFLTLVSIYDSAGADGPGKKNEPLPPQSNACNSNGKGPEHKCNQPTVEVTEVKVQPTPVVTKEPTKVKPQPTKVVTSEPTVLPQVTPTPEVTATQEVTTTTALTACGDEEVCDPCEFLTDALANGMMVIILDKDKVEVYEDMSMKIHGQFDLLATGLLSQSGYGD